MIICRPPKNGVIKTVHLEFDADANLQESIESAIRLARGFSDRLSSCRVFFKYEGVEFEVSEFSNASDLMNYFSMRRRMRATDTMPGSPA